MLQPSTLQHTAGTSGPTPPPGSDSGPQRAVYDASAGLVQQLAAAAVQGVMYSVGLAAVGQVAEELGPWDELQGRVSDPGGGAGRGAKSLRDGVYGEGSRVVVNWVGGGWRMADGRGLRWHGTTAAGGGVRTMHDEHVALRSQAGHGAVAYHPGAAGGRRGALGGLQRT